MLSKLSCCSVLMLLAFSVNAADVQWWLDESNGQLSVDIQRPQPLDSVLIKLSEEMGFRLELEQGRYSDVYGRYKGTPQQVINKLVRPASVFVSSSDKPPYKVSRVILLPAGDEQSQHLPSGRSGNPMTSGGVYTGPEHNREKFERRVQRGH